MQQRLEARIAELPTDPAVLLRLLEQRHLLELSAWEACPEFVALKRALAVSEPEKAARSDDDAFEAYKQREGNCTDGSPHPMRMASIDWQLLRRAFDAGAAVRSERPRWISVKERFPEKNQIVAVRCRDDSRAVGWWTGSQWDRKYEDPVDDWMPLPDAPSNERTKP